MSRRVTLRRATALLVVCTLPALGACTSRHRQVTWLSPETYPEREALEFRRASPSAPWRVELRARLINNTPPPAIAADRGGRASTVDARLTKKLRFSGKQVETLSSYYHGLSAR